MVAAPNLKHDNAIPLFPPQCISMENQTPQYTRSSKQRGVLALHCTLCIVTFGEKSLCPIWEQKHAPESGAWEYGRDMLREHIQHMNIVIHTLDFCAGEYFPTFVGWFTSYHDHVPLHHQCTEGLHIQSIHEGGSHLSLAFGPCVFLHRSHHQVHDYDGDQESAVRLVLQCELRVLLQASGMAISYQICRLGYVGDESQDLVDYDSAWVSILVNWSVNMLSCCW